MISEAGSGTKIRWHAALAVAALVAVASGCAQQPKPELPSLAKDQRRLLTKDEQKQAINTLGQNKDRDFQAAQTKIDQTK